MESPHLLKGTRPPPTACLLTNGPSRRCLNCKQSGFKAVTIRETSVCSTPTQTLSSRAGVVLSTTVLLKDVWCGVPRGWQLTFAQRSGCTDLTLHLPNSTWKALHSTQKTKQRCGQTWGAGVGGWGRLLNSPWNSPDHSTGGGSLSLLQGIFPTQEANQGLLHCRQILYQLSY